MWAAPLLLALQGAASLVAAQLTLPNPPFLPPSASAGATNSSGGFPNPQWTSLLGTLLYFYDEQRSGTLPSTNRVPWRNDSLILEGLNLGIDLTGGFYDAGGQWKSAIDSAFFIRWLTDNTNQTSPRTPSLLALCSLHYAGEQQILEKACCYDMANQTAYLDDTLRWGLDWLIKAHPNDTTLVVMVASSDVNYWGGDRSIPQPRPVYTITNDKPGTDAAAGAAAAFAACSNLYASRAFSGNYSAPASLRNDSYSATLLTHAQQLYSFAVNATGGRKTYQTSVPAAADIYPSSSYGDELTMAALFLAYATGSATTYADAEAFYTKYSLDKGSKVFNWDSKASALPILFAQMNQANPSLGGNFSAWRDRAESYLDDVVGKGHAGGFMTPDGLLYFDGDSDDASLNPALNTAMLLERFVPMATTADKKVAYMNFAKSQVDYVLGKNSMSVPYIVGVNPNSPQNPHSAMASGGIDVGKIDTVPAQEAYVLSGAVVGGPDKRGRFFDIRSDWPQTEVALDYNAPMLTLAAMHVSTVTEDPYFTRLAAGAYDKVRPKGSPCDAAIDDGCHAGRLSKKATLAMAVTLTVVGLVIVGLSAWYLILLVRPSHLGLQAFKNTKAG
ncbi:hypothetical protein D9619_000754 [Psilocybe cf. subviscida]|uniref:Endoglucanase n=1 Tax=Psilocybe cf. subviscida TaxID=2480587 RepID=A0A8H5F2W1_9AGAR|nr:hypothetical protein D9619_000754 [Psilocybe cf. subviscida]